MTNTSLDAARPSVDMSVATPTSAEGVVTLEMINELQQQVLDNNPIYKYLLSDVSSRPGAVIHSAH